MRLNNTPKMVHRSTFTKSRNLLIVAIVGIAMNAFLPGKDYEFGTNEQGDTSVNFGPR